MKIPILTVTQAMMVCVNYYQSALLMQLLADTGFNLKFAVPFEGADEMITVRSGISWTKFMSQLVDIMGVTPKHVCVAYCFSTDPQSTWFGHLIARTPHDAFSASKTESTCNQVKKGFLCGIEGS